MKKVISINFSGRLINIEEDAYAALQNYIESLKVHFQNEEGKDEIIADIENRIAEIFYDKQTKGATSINIDDVNQVMNTIGKPEDFDQSDENVAGNSGAYQNDTTQKVGKGRLYRDSKDKYLGGVCSGLAAYFNIDTVLVRIIFIVLLFGAGSGFFLYILLWIFVPESAHINTSIEKRLYRNNDDRIFGGVSSGIAHYFGIDVWIPRIIFAAPFLFSFIRGIISLAYHDHITDRFWQFSFGGTTTVVYFLLWWIIPEAKSVQEKMAMKGQKLDLNTIKNNIQGDLKTFGNKANEWSKQITDKTNEWSKNFSEKTNRSTGNKIAEGIGLIFKGFALFIGGTIAFSILMSLMAVLISGFEFWPFKTYLLENGWQELFFWGTLMLLLLPGIAFIVWILRRITKSKKYSKQISVTFGILTFLGFASATFLAASISRSVKSDNDSRAAVETPIQQPSGKLLLTVSEPEVTYSGELPWINIEDGKFDINKDSLKYANIKVRFHKSNDNLYHIRLKKYSRGRNVEDAESKAQKIRYNFIQNDSVIDLGSHISVSKNEKFRGQQVVVIVDVPVGKKVRINQTVLDKLNPFNIRITENWDNGRRSRKKVVHDYDNMFEFIPDADYIMLENGKLALANKPKDDVNKETDEIIEEKKRIIEEKERELEEKRKQKIKDSLDNEIKKLETKKNEISKLTFQDETFYNKSLSIPFVFCNI